MARNVVSLLFVAAMILAAPLATAQAQVSEDVVTNMSNDDPMMRKAFRRARTELDAFLKTARAPASHQSDFAVKVGLHAGERTEYVWISDFSEDTRGNFSGVINNEVQIATKYKLGDTYRFTRAEIVDWLYFDAREVRMYGNYTLCALLTLEPAEQAAKAIAEYKLDCAL